MALFSRRVSDVCEASFFVAPLTESGRQLTLARISIQRLGDDDVPLVNVLVLPVPSSVFRGPVVADAKQYIHVWEDLRLSFEQPQIKLPETPHIVAFHASSNRLRVCSSLAELKHVRMDGLSLALPPTLLEEVEHRYADGFAFIVLAFRERPISTLLVAYTHPILRDSLFVPLLCAAPRGIPRGERPSIVVDDAPSWSQRTASIFSVDTGAAFGKSLHCSARTPFSASRIGVHPLTSIRSLNVQPRKDEWMPLSSLYSGILQLQSLIACGDWPEAQRVITSMMKRKPNSCLVRAHNAQLCAARGQRDEAKREFETAISIDPSNAVPWLMLGNFHFGNGRQLKAAKAYKGALERDPNNAASMVGLGMCIAATDRDKHEEARALFKRAIHTDPKNSEAKNALAALELALPLPYEQRHAIAHHEHEEKKDAVHHFDAYFSHLHEESTRLFLQAPNFDSSEQ